MDLTTRCDRLKAFAYVQAEKAPLYRRVMGIFVEAKTRFALHLRPQDVLEALGRLEEVAPVDAVSDGEELEKAFKQLCDWGNLEAHPDTAEVATVEEFYRKRFLYQLTPEGEAAERALAVYHDTIEQPGELQTAALADIRELLAELLQLANMDTVDAGKVHRTLLALTGRFDELTARAQSFMGSLQRTIDLQGVDLESFLSYKDKLIEYLERFIGELVMTTSEIAATLGRLAAADPDRLLKLAARRDLADAVAPTEDDHAAAFAAWRARWKGLRSWFVGSAGGSQAELLRARARAAIPALLNAVIGIHDRRVRRSDRFTDLRTLARWFAETDSDHQAHRLWRTAFGLTPARHLRIDATTLDLYDQKPVAADTSWLDAPPLRLTPRLRRTGHFRRRGRATRVIDRSKEKEMLAQLVADETEQIAEARRRLAGGPMRLWSIAHFERGAFDLFLDLLGPGPRAPNTARRNGGDHLRRRLPPHRARAGPRGPHRCAQDFRRPVFRPRSHRHHPRPAGRGQPALHRAKARGLEGRGRGFPMTAARRPWPTSPAAVPTSTAAPAPPSKTQPKIPAPTTGSDSPPRGRGTTASTRWR